MTYPVLIIGGGLAGLTTGIELSRAGIRVLLIERKNYPHHKVCGEYISNEVRPYLKKLGLDPTLLGAAEINSFRFTSPRGHILDSPLTLGGFGLSRYLFDDQLYQLAKASGVEFLLNTSVSEVHWNEDHFTVQTAAGDEYKAEVVMGAYGKRARLDRELHRDFMQQTSPYMGVKYHIQYDFPKDTIALHNFRNGYCGISAIEDDKYCMCYLTERSNVKMYGSIPEMERQVLAQNPHIYTILKEAKFLYDSPEVINEISFAPKKAVVNHILMSGDAAGLITPLCGNGMAMAIHGGWIAAQEIIEYYKKHRNRKRLEDGYTRRWNEQFSTRLWVGRNVQRMFGNETLSEFALHFFGLLPPLLRLVIRNTHGKPFITS
ncbi:NAD(P)/FAD-dependent oxidoreductase [Telluribacter sp. SYSU D00476]|uniref:NAD(P)/FAD-dependent oxidoreductase n=1 Tax=Telluribacter sp. SYSU D00476 TaxID=2811430 RepID=UPI001FF40EDC|nr:FAD-dependent oxidoreductase [Telluribacter sp. SYSU D00476]